ncbi:TOBE domain-containing protein [Acetobacter sp. AN02]|uniref:TOBE domain-containing protein n=1 Tax=Acetobacter sp. AN02 TaxID=2894186 RepID=UPI00243455A8|nr:TOBE domain-containing protein [Acetobacter sp. AN02]MDG6093653.1 TOBE domain-containing protein [Acetobacter sp. AN02]
MHPMHHSPGSSAIPAQLFSSSLFPEATGLTRLRLQPGHCLALIGPGGPDTLMQDILSGFLSSPPMQEQARKTILVSAALPLLPSLTIRENIALPLRGTATERRSRVSHSLALTGLDSAADLKPADLPPSSRLLATCARALACSPAMIVLNTPFAGMDFTTRHDLCARLDRLRQACGVSLLLLTGERDEALLLGQRIGILSHDTLLQEGTAEELFNRPDSAAVATGFGEANLLRGIVLDTEDDIARIRLAAGPEVEAIATPGLQPGQLADLCIRPGRITPVFVSGTDDDPDEGSLPAVLTGARMLPDVLRLRFRLPDGTEVIADRPALLSTRGFDPGRRARLAWQTGAASAFPSGTDQG